MTTTTEILLKCEENGTAPKYIEQKDTYREITSSFFGEAKPVRTKPVEYNTGGEEIFVVSDLHIAAGRNDAGVYHGTENFFADDSFYRFLEYADRIKQTPKALLVINGDIFDFLRITEFPGKVRKIRFSQRIKHSLKLRPLKKPSKPSAQSIEDEYQEWMTELEKIGIKKSRKELERSISKKEMIYGLKTDDYKTVYKLIKIKNGHPAFFKALSRWMKQGNKIVILKGNHDLELYWPAIRNYLRLIIAEGILDENKESGLEEILIRNVLPNITFIDDSVVIDKDFYVEHGHRYDKFCLVLDGPVLKNNPGEINIPFGSFFNRYLLNRLELYYPFLDNVKPSENILPLLLKENFPLGLKVMFQYIPVLIKLLWKNFRYTWFMFNRVFWFLLFILLPFILVFIFRPSIISDLKDQISNIKNIPDAGSFITDKISYIGPFIISFFLGRLTAWFHLSEPSDLSNYAKPLFENTNYKIITMGHTHTPGESKFEINNIERRFYNTGTWIPVIELSTAEVSEDKTYIFLHLQRDAENNLIPSDNGLLQRWDDSAGRAEGQVIIEKK